MDATSAGGTHGYSSTQSVDIVRYATGTAIRRIGTCQITSAMWMDLFGGASIAAKARQITIADLRIATIETIEQQLHQDPAESK